MKVIRGRKALVTGASSGIGRAIALALAREGTGLVLADRDAEPLRSTADAARSHGVEAAAVICDLTEPGQISALVEEVKLRWGELHILVNGAGLAYLGPAHNVTSEEWRQILGVNLLAPIQLWRELQPMMMATDEAHLLNVCSIVGLATARGLAPYQTSKYALVGFTEALRAEYGRCGFGVTALCPGFVRTPMLDENALKGRPDRPWPKVPEWLTTSPEHVAEAAISAIKRDKSLVVVTAHARLLWWLKRLSPAFVGWCIREGWRRRGRPNIEADIAAREQWLAQPTKSFAGAPKSRAALRIEA